MCWCNLAPVWEVNKVYYILPRCHVRLCIYFSFLGLQLFQSDKVLCTHCCPGEVTSRSSSLQSYQMLTLWLSSAKLQMHLWSKTIFLSILWGVLFLCLKPIIIPAKSARFTLLNGLNLEFLQGFLVLIQPAKARMLLLVQTTSLSSDHPFTHASMQGLGPRSYLALCSKLCYYKYSSSMTRCRKMVKMM